MILTAEHRVTNSYRVEVSGWDDNKAFFVENSELEWTDDSGKQVTLSCGLADRAVVFAADGEGLHRLQVVLVARAAGGTPRVCARVFERRRRAVA